MKAAIIVAIILLAVGLIVTVVGICITNFKFDFKPSTQCVELEEDFNRISVDVATSDIKFLPSDTGKSFVEIVSSGNPNLRHNVQIKNGVMSISEQDDRKWYEHVSIGWSERSVTVYLATADFEALTIETNTGYVTVPKEFSFRNAEIEVDTGDVTFAANVFGKLSVDSDTGKVSVSGSPDCESLEIQSDTGNITVENVKASGSVSIESNTGKVTLNGVVAGEMLYAKTSTGNVSLDSCDGSTVNITTSTGDVSGTLLTEKYFDAHSGTGDVTVPSGRNGGKCKIRCSTGNIKISVKQ